MMYDILEIIVNDIKAKSKDQTIDTKSYINSLYNKKSCENEKVVKDNKSNISI